MTKDKGQIMKVGLVGFAGSGKTTIFNTLTGLAAEVGGYGAKEKANIGVIKVPDARVDKLAELFNPKKKTFAEISFVDVAGPQAETERAETGLDPKLVQHMRDVDALVHVVRAFDNPMLLQEADPARDIRAFDDELVLTDLVQVENRINRLKKEKDSARESELMQRLKDALESETPLRNLALAPEELTMMAGFRFLSLKPLLLLLNVGEDRAASEPPAEIAELASSRNVPLIAMAGKVEMEIAQLAPDEQRDFLADLGITEPARDRFIRAAYGLLDLISFLTAGEDECRAWSIRRGTYAQKAAGAIHSDIERGFIRAEVIRFEDLISCGSEARCREQGKLRLEGKDYIVQDGDVIHFRFNV
ncbi:MAG TPA: redox-regulated ATPase YchF [Blastocatellia bacterium]|nr:redox-regulated ATPase YchF [Blastocatellia bacterium]